MFTNENPFSDHLWSEIKSGVTQGILNPGPHYAAFDADGTLWPYDAGETFFRWQIANCNLNFSKDPWGHYWELKDRDAPASCLWLAQINKGQRLTHMREWARKCFLENEKNFPLHKDMFHLIKWLKENKVQVYIVTASIKWAVEPWAVAMGIPAENVLGIETVEKSGLLTDEAKLPLTYGEGKPAVIVQHKGGIRPVLAAGNTYSDSFLVESATNVFLAVASDKLGEHNYDSEEKMREIGRAKKWLIHQF